MTFEGVSGPYGRGSLPPGQYKGDNIRKRKDNRGMRCNAEGWSLDIEPENFSTDRTDLRIHPDGNRPGTLGCIGVACGFSQADFLGSMLFDYLGPQGNSSITIEVVP